MRNSLKDIIQRCHKRHENPLWQRKTVVTPAIYKGLLYHFTVYCAHRYPVSLHDLEKAGISFMPIGGGPRHDRVPQSFGGERFLRRQRIEDWGMRQWHTSWGIQVYTGIPSGSNSAQWHDLEFSYESICAAPDDVFSCIDALVSIVRNPLLTLTASGGLRFSCRVQDYLHPRTEAARLYIYKNVSTPNNPDQRDVYLEILGEAGHSPWDARYEILVGDLLNPPIISKEVLFASINTLRQTLHDPAPLGTEGLKPTSHVFIFSTPSLGSHKLDLAKEALLKREFSYLREESGFHYWTQHADKVVGPDVLLSERDGTVWIRACTPDVGLPTTDTPITEIWDDTGILPLIGEVKLPMSEKVRSIREGKLSPLAIKRPSPVLQKPKDIEKIYEPLEKNIDQTQIVFDSDKRVIGLTAETGARSSYEMETHLLKSGAVNFSGVSRVVKEAIQHFQRQKLPSLTLWKNYRFHWDQVKETPIDVRMATPFERSNVCEDAARCQTLVEKGADPSESICPKCPVYTTCQEHGYLSQPTTLQRAKTQIFGTQQLLLDPAYSALVEEILQPAGDTERLCIIAEASAEEMFLECSISKNTLEAWRINWQESALGNFAQALLYALEIESEPDNLVAKRIRMVMQAFQEYEAELVKQMCHVNVRGKVVKRGIIDDETKEELAHFTIEFEGGVSVYIPRDSNAETRLSAKDFPIFRLESLSRERASAMFQPAASNSLTTLLQDPPTTAGLDEDIRIPMSIEKAIRLGILDVGTVEKIQELPSVYRNLDWTLWHQLKRFLTHYTRDADAPMIWHNGVLKFWVPPVLHPSVKKLLLMSATLSERDFRSIFPDEEIEAICIKPTSWAAENQVFQIRTGVHTHRTILDYDSTWDVIGLSKMAERFLLGICAEIERDPSVKHAIITYPPVIKQLKDVEKRENLCLLTGFKSLYNQQTALEAAEVVWIVGTPFWQPGVIWRQAQFLYGNDKEPLSYEMETEFEYYKDERIQRIYTQTVTGLITEIIGRAGLNRWVGKKVVLISSLEIPDITDRPETLLFDWEDFEVAGSLNELAKTIATRQKFETKRDNLTAASSRAEVERILGCSSRQANRMLKKLRGRNIPRVTLRDQILSLLADGEKKAADVIASIDGNPSSIYRELMRLSKNGEIQKVGWGMYALETE